MGWWQSNGCELGDGSLDITNDFLEKFSSEYISELGRKPTLEELLNSLASILGPFSSEFISQPDQSIISISAKVAKSRKRVKLQPGNIFSVPLSKKLKAYGRLTPQLGYAEFFSVFQSRRPSLSALLGSHIIRPPWAIVTDKIKTLKWPIVGHVPFVAYVPMPFLVGHLVACAVGPLNEFTDLTSELRNPLAEEPSHLQAFSIANEEYIIQYLDRIANGAA
jgi:hypothetical protein